MLGNKIDNLTKMYNSGINVPEFIAIKFEDIINVDNYYQELDILIKEKEVTSKELKELIINNLNLDIDINLKGNLYSVRSSSNIEDSKDMSFAGQFQTFLNIKKEDIKDKIKECVLSLFEQNVLDYLNNNKIDIKNIKMNVIVQKMVNSEYSGIMFTANPQGLLNESVITVGKGLGENIVSDKVESTSYYYNLTDKIYYYEGKEDYLSNEIIEELIYTSNKIKELFSDYLDIEFAIEKNKIFILQAREITTLNKDNPLILDNSNIVESYPDISLPLTCSFVNMVYSGVFKGVSRRVLKNEKELSKHEDVFNNMVGSANGRMYYKISNWYTLIKFLPFHKKIIPVWQEMLGVKIKNYDEKEVDLSLTTRFMTYINSFYELLSVPKNMDKLNKDFIKINESFYSTYKEDIDNKELIKLYNKIKKELLSVWDVTLLNDMYTFIFTGLLKHRLKKKYNKDDQYVNQYISSISNIESMKPIKELINIAYNKDKYSEEEYKKLKNKYIQEYGDRNLEELKLESETYRSNPSIFDERINEYRQDMKKLENIYKDFMDEKKLSVKEDFITKFLIKRCTTGIMNREISRLNRSRIFGIVRTIFLKIGNSFVEEKIIKEQRDIFYLTIDEVFDLVKNPSSQFNLVESRKNEYELYKQLPTYTRLIFDYKEFNKSHTTINSNKLKLNKDELQGIPCSNGIVEGEVLVVNDVNNVGNVKDKILVTKMTDPGWVFLLTTAKGVISEKGSLLSHTAIISRELKIPSIVGVEKVLSILETGDYIKMDGNTGKIKVIKKR